MTSLKTSMVLGWVMLAGLCWAAQPAAAQRDNGPSPVVVSRVVQREVSPDQAFIGSVVALRHSTIGSAVDGRVAEVFFEEGQSVGMQSSPQDGQTGTAPPLGQPLVQLRTATLDIELEAARQQLQLQQQQYNQLKASLPEEIQQAKANVKSTQASATYTESKFVRTKNLYEQRRNAVTEEEFQEAQSEAEAARQQHQVALSTLRQLEATKEARLQQAQARVAAQQQEIARLTDMRSKYTIRTPFAGVVIVKHTEIGAWISRGDPVAEVVQLDPIELRVFVPEDQIAHVQQQMTAVQRKGTRLTAQITLDALPGEQFQGQVVGVVPKAEERSRAFPVRIVVPNPVTQRGRLLQPGMLARAQLSTEMRSQKLLVPKDALVLDQSRAKVYVVDQIDPSTQVGSIREVQVELHQAYGNLVQVDGKLQAGEVIVTVGNERLRPHQQVRILRETEPNGRP